MSEERQKEMRVAIAFLRAICLRAGTLIYEVFDAERSAPSAPSAPAAPSEDDADFDISEELMQLEEMAAAERGRCLNPKP